MSKTATYLVYFCAYSLILLILGKSGLRNTRSSRDYFLCERSNRLLPSICTFTGTWVSAVTILSLTGSVYEDGYAVLLYSVIPWFLGAFLLGLITKKLYRNDAITVPEIFRKRFDSRGLQIVYGCVFIAVYIGYLVAQYKGFGQVVSEAFEIPYPIAVTLVFLFIIYTTFGGYRSVIRTDIFNLCLLIGSLAMVMFTLVGQAGGFSALYSKAALVEGFAHSGMAAPTVKGHFLSLFSDKFTPITSLSMFWGWGLGLAANPQYIVRLLGARDEKTAQRTLWLSLPVLALIYFSLIHIGLSMRVLVPSLEGVSTTDEIMVHLMNNELYAPLSGFFLFSVIGSCVSTANSQLLLVASSFAYDVCRAAKKEEPTEKHTIRLGQLAVVGGAAVTMLLTLNPPKFSLSYGGDVWGIIAILLFPAIYGIMLSDKVTRRGVWACLIAGAASIAVFYPLHHHGVLTAHPAIYGTILSCAAMCIVSALDRKHSGGSAR